MCSLSAGKRDYRRQRIALLPEPSISAGWRVNSPQNEANNFE
jgi:hypothetical protein